MADQTIGAPTYNVPYSSISRDVEQGGEDILAATKGLGVIADTVAQISGERKADAFEEGLEAIGSAAVAQALEEALRLRDPAVFNDEEQSILGNIDRLYERATYTTGSKKAAVLLQAKRMIQDQFANTGSNNVRTLLKSKYSEFFQLHPSMDMLDALDASQTADQTFAATQLDMIQKKSYQTKEQGGYEIPQHYTFLGREWRSAYLGAVQLEHQAQALQLATGESMRKVLTEGGTPEELVSLTQDMLAMFHPNLIDSYVWNPENYSNVPVRITGVGGDLHDLFIRADNIRERYTDILVNKTATAEENESYIREYQAFQEEVTQFFTNRNVELQQLKAAWATLKTGEHKELADLYLNKETGVLASYESMLTNWQNTVLKLDDNASPLKMFEAMNALAGEQNLFERPTQRKVIRLLKELEPLLDSTKHPWITHKLQQVLEQANLGGIWNELTKPDSDSDGETAAIRKILQSVAGGETINLTSGIQAAIAAAGGVTSNATPDNTVLPPNEMYKQYALALASTDLLSDVLEVPTFTLPNQPYPEPVIHTIAYEAAWLMKTANNGASSFTDGRAGIETRYTQPEFYELVANYMDKTSGKTKEGSLSFGLLGTALNKYYIQNNYAASVKENLRNHMLARSWQGASLLDLVDVNVDGLEEFGNVEITVKPDAAEILASFDTRIGKAGDYSETGESLEGVPLEGRGLYFINIPEEVYYMQDRLTGILPALSPTKDTVGEMSQRNLEAAREIYGEEQVGKIPPLSEADYSLMIERLELVAPMLAEKLTTWAKLDALKWMLSNDSGGARVNPLEVLAGNPDPALRMVLGASK